MLTRFLKQSIWLILVGIFTASASQVQAATYYLSPTGNDTTGTGAETAPWFSLKRAFDGSKTPRLQPGDTLLLKGGTYKPTVKDLFNVNGKSGTETAYITIKNAPGETPVITSELMSPDLNQGVITFYASKYINISGIKLDAAHSTFGKESRGFFIDGQSQYINASDMTITNSFRKGVGLSGQHLILENSEVYNTSRNNADAAKDRAQGCCWEQAVSTFTGADDITIRNNYVHENWGEGIDIIFGKNVKIQNNILHDNYGVNIYLDNAYNIEITGNVTYRNSGAFDQHKQDGSIYRAKSIHMANENNDSANFLRNILVRDNLLGLGNRRGISYFQDYGNYNGVTIDHNTVVGQTEQGIWYEATSGTLGTNAVTNNIFYKSPTHAVIDIGNTSAWTFSHNAYINGAAPSYASSGSDTTTNPNLPATVNVTVTKPYGPTRIAALFGSYFNNPLTASDYGARLVDVPTPSPSVSPSPSPSTSPTACQQADINDDNKVNILDYTILVSNFFSDAPNPPKADIDGNGIVNILDFTLLAGQFLKDC